MNNHRVNNLLLAAIAAGLWANALLPLFRPMPVAAQSSSIEHLMGNIEHNVNDIAHGFCPNRNICGYK